MTTAPQRRVRTRVTTRVERILAGPYRASVQNIHLDAWKVGDTWHGDEHCARRDAAGRGGPYQVKVAFKKVPEQLGEYVCTAPECLMHVLTPRIPHHNRWNAPAGPPAPERLLAEAHYLVEQEDETVKLEKPLAKKTAVAVERRRAAAERLHAHAAREAAGQEPGAKSWEVIRERTEKVLEDLAAYAKDDEHQAKVLTWVRRDLLPAQLAHLDPNAFTLDETPTLVGIVPYLPQRHNQKVRALVETFGIRNSGGTIVLSVPRFVYDHLQRSEIGRMNGGVLLQGVPAPQNPAVAETAAGLWDPEGTANLASLADAVTAARILVEGA